MKGRIRTILTATVLLALLAASDARSELVTARGTAPASDNLGTCLAPILLPMGINPALRVQVRWWLAGADSLAGAAVDSAAVLPGAPFAIARELAPGLWRIRVWPVDQGGAGCDTTVSRLVVKPPGDKVRDFRAP